MPPRVRREAPGRRDGRIRKHLAQARDYWLKWPAHLTEGDYCQAGEKGWGTVAQLTEAVATLRSWDHYDHDAIREAITALADEIPQQSAVIYRGLTAAEALHGNFYEVYMNVGKAEVALDDLRPMLDLLWGLLPARYTSGASFEEWTEAELID